VGAVRERVEVRVVFAADVRAVVAAPDDRDGDGGRVGDLLGSPRPRLAATGDPLGELGRRAVGEFGGQSVDDAALPVLGHQRPDGFGEQRVQPDGVDRYPPCRPPAARTCLGAWIVVFRGVSRRTGVRTVL
jgi:hypothetical protein